MNKILTTVLSHIIFRFLQLNSASMTSMRYALSAFKITAVCRAFMSIILNP